MERRETTLLVGAGAECSEPFNLPSGKDFVWETCYTQKDALYEALQKFYENRFAGEIGKKRYAPRTYQANFLYGNKGKPFKRLIENLSETDDGKRFIRSIRPHSDIENLTDDDYIALFREIIISDQDKNRKEQALKALPDDSYYGSIECYFSSLINPSRRHASFWRLINYYWSAFFSIATPLIQRKFADDRRLTQQGVYRYTLDNLNNVVLAISDKSLFLDDSTPNYYKTLSNYFDNVITTNYTSFSDTALRDESTSGVHLSGALWEFESLSKLATRDVRDEPISDEEFIFPYLMTQAPIKPIVDAQQIKNFSSAIRALNRTRVLVILGYSLCDSDTHIISLIRDYLERDGAKIIYLDYGNSKTPEAICEQLRASSEHSNKIEIKSCTEHSINELKQQLRNQV